MVIPDLLNEVIPQEVVQITEGSENRFYLHSFFLEWEVIMNEILSIIIIIPWKCVVHHVNFDSLRHCRCVI